ncbi:subtilase family protein [Striga asiatica]|uniref:Subtilase family protein n=1 Tax=Striga asiatica TaxID=4170 RepID=A0A5A7NW74_STRAF|nr:subtilase family protein [Striga asiatica]
MEKFKLSIILLLFLLPLLNSLLEEKQVYIVYFGEHKGVKTTQEIEENHISYLLSVKKTKQDAKVSLIYSYKHSFNGFAAFLTQLEANKLSEREEVVSVFRSYPRKYSLHTTRSWEFAGLQGEENLKKKDSLLLKSKYGKNVIIGMMDSGVWPESQSFNDIGMDDIPNSWKGICQSGDGFNSSQCNKKIIGARYYIKGYEAQYGPLNRTLDYLSPRDMDGHGTHTASIAAGREVGGVSSLGGFAFGTASGGAPLARLAIYKVCWALPIDGGDSRDGTCFDEDILAAVDDAIRDGVHVLSVSIGSSHPITDDFLAIGALHAVNRGIVVASSAGNSGPAKGTVVNEAPWMITVGASSIDRRFPSPVLLGNGQTIPGQTVTPYKLENNKKYPLVFAGQVIKTGVDKDVIGQCLPGSLSLKKVRGKIVLCFSGNGSRAGKGMEVKRAGGAGLILADSEKYGNLFLVEAHILPATSVTYKNALKIYDYIQSTKHPTASIVPAKTVLPAKPAPFMAAFTSRGPNPILPYILKPDITAPGLNILAAWSEVSGPSYLVDDHRSVKYNILSGTSMSTPHVAGALALLKAIHPDWTDLIDNEGNPITDAYGNPADPFQYGSGHFNPTKAADPGLVYNASYTDYLLFLCSIGVHNLSSTKCPKNPPHPFNLNYPSLAIPNLNDTVTVVRTVTNVDCHGPGVYFASIQPPPGISVEIRPSVLYFSRAGESKSFTITVKTEGGFTGTIKKGEYSFGWFRWSNEFHVVQSPMAVSVLYCFTVHIVFLSDHDESRAAEEIEDQHHSYLLSVKENEEDAKSSIIYSYKNIGGFSALLTRHEALKLSGGQEI